MWISNLFINLNNHLHFFFCIDSSINPLIFICNILISFCLLYIFWAVQSFLDGALNCVDNDGAYMSDDDPDIDSSDGWNSFNFSSFKSGYFSSLSMICGLYRRPVLAS